MARLESWEKKLADFIEERSDKPFEWGKNDCCLFVADAVKAITGIDYAASFRTKYENKNGAYKALKKFASGDIIETIKKIANQNNFKEISPKLAKRGDIGIVYPKQALVICLGSKWAWQGEKGLEFISYKDIFIAWSIE
jgi:hypothetical protein